MDDLASIYKEHRAEFLHWIQKQYNCSESDGKDLYQIAILTFYENVRNGRLLQLTSSIKTYLFAIAKNVLKDNQRRSARYVSIDQTIILREAVLDERAYDSSEEMSKSVENALRRLNQRCARLLIMFYYEGKSMHDIAMAMNIKNAETAKNMKCKCMRRFRKLVLEEYRKLSKEPEIVSGSVVLKGMLPNIRSLQHDY